MIFNPYRRRRTNWSMIVSAALCSGSLGAVILRPTPECPGAMPSRRSGGAKEQQPAEQAAKGAAASAQENSAGRSLVGWRVLGTDLVAPCHHLPSGPPTRPAVKTA